MFKSLLILITLFVAQVTLGAPSYYKPPYYVTGTTSTATAGGTTTLTDASSTNQIFTGTSTQDVVLPNATSLPVGRPFYIANRSTGAVTIKYQDNSTAATVEAGSQKHLFLRAASANGTWDFSGTGAVTSVGVSMPSTFEVSNSPITSTGTIGVAYVSQASNLVLAGPVGGSSAPPTMRALIGNDLVSAPVSLASMVTGTLGATSGGTGLTGYTSGAVLFANSPTTISQINPGSNGQTLTMVAGAPAFANAGASLLAPASVSMAAASTVATDVNIAYLNAGGGSFPVSYPLPASTANQLLWIKKTDLTTNVASGAVNITEHLYTPNETYLFHSTGTAYETLAHNTFYKFPNITSLTSVISVPTGVKPVGGNTTNSGNVDQTSLIRRGSKLFVTMNFKQTTAGTAGGSNCYMFDFRSSPLSAYNFVIDTTQPGTNTNAVTAGSVVDWRNAVGFCKLSDSGGSSGAEYVASVVSSTALKFSGLSGNYVTNSCWGSSVMNFSATTLSAYCELFIPIVGWKE